MGSTQQPLQIVGNIFNMAPVGTQTPPANTPTGNGTPILDTPKVKEADNAIQGYSRSMTMLSISMFVTVLIVRQMTTAIMQLGKFMGLNKEETDQLNKSVQAMNAAMGLAAGPIQLYIMWGTIAKGTNMLLAYSFLSLGSAMMSVFAIYGAFTAESTKLKLIFSALTGVTIALAAASYMMASASLATARAAEIAAIAKTKEAIASGMVAAMNPLTAWYIPVAIGLIAGLATFIGSLAMGETSEGSYRTVERSGPIYAHAGEKLGRISAQNGTQGSGGGNRSITIISNDPLQTAKMIERNDRRGLGRKRIKRAVV
jgi:hypothetical protein